MTSGRVEWLKPRGNDRRDSGQSRSLPVIVHKPSLSRVRDNPSPDLAVRMSLGMDVDVGVS